MKFGVLGPLAMTEEDTPEVCRLPPGPMTRQLLGLLLLNAGCQVSLDSCVEELWGDKPPRSAVQSVHTRIFQIRRAIAACPTIGGRDAAKQLLVTHHHGYSLHIRPGSLDLHVLKHHLTRAREARLADDDPTVSTALRAALALWRGPTLADVDAGAHIQARRVGLEDLRMTLLEQRLDAELRLGLHHELLAELGMLAARHPVHENIHAQYMLALHRSGRSVQALDIYRAVRATLLEELGMEPSTRLRQLQRAILADSTDLEPAHHPAARPPADSLTLVP
ncbi:AfsR/SARP family transcriptional regulator [Streptomyces durbertensis]|uniref:AfsR/SARP family transcriptional regulator n=1 Tax=Streptomyces durbertensis TaxID=2448886 RepID=A0ABR6EPX4_9ACTN|nr:AfsR/SARP family transcriptional regulator [Streptomyces durbertensis]MBB1247198.1 AfsR/SARP family transcriptional regulator [Streptomyces durbertensis]